MFQYNGLVAFVSSLTVPVRLDLHPEAMGEAMMTDFSKARVSTCVSPSLGCAARPFRQRVASKQRPEAQSIYRKARVPLGETY